MANIELLKGQHQEILDIISEIEEVSNKESSNEAIVKLINVLSGKLKVHLSIEDKHLYPSLLNNPNYKVRLMAQEYMDEMGDLVSEYNNFKSQFNTSSKLDQNSNEFEKQRTLIFKILKKRIIKEDSELYLQL